MAKKKAPVKKNLWKGKQWYEVVSPKVFGEKTLSETPSSDPKNLMGRTLTSNLSLLTGNPIKYYFKINFKINDINGSKCSTKYFGHDCSRDYISRLVRRGSTRIDTRDVVTTKDGHKIVVKTISVTIRKTLTSIKNELRKSISQQVVERVSEMNLDDFVKNMISGKMQKEIKKEVSKVYPVREVEFRKTEILE